MQFSTFTFFTFLTTITAFPVDTSKRSESYNVKSCSAFYDSQYAAFSCHASGTVPSKYSCCYEAKNGVVLHTQFWDYDTNENSDASTKFTIHGLWNDKCDGSYEQYCNDDLEVKAANLDNLIGNTFDDQDLLNTMKTYWLNNGGTSESLWEHEYNKHGTCFSTLQPSCYASNYQNYETAYDFYRKVVEVWESRPTYDWLSSAGITPSSDDTYSLSDIQDALSQKHGAQVYVGCSDSDAVNQIYYYYNIEGNVLTGKYKSIDTLTDSNCPDTVRYLPKN
ncbi:putative ribonuclease M [[Candida] railenensis]|uniref:ribonuclease T2 n=1 Tax=[Candida] railenensis TaxID=45579 RepID=A0A9P0QT71_9ASCO|nr:putative ribonuclease M [[Candida] railenensis]